MAENFNGDDLADANKQKLKQKNYAAAGLSTAKQRMLEDGEVDVDRRTLRTTGRTELFSARVTAATKKGLHAYAKTNGKLLGEVLEEMLEIMLKAR